ncbi:hypothetical protein K431DRAFT_295427 [Polychaeton citri CBS 116435]|uniref:SH3 domain-containing protein n=1 Tax=Polychaeton citri CBS 116435 TaxID=1314669 RepID=A0A9P4Q6I8_9PEZI|nr:hypothetical protein K431DRAFT_295427 [Polychaeton citri CBS 116435]
MPGNSTRSPSLRKMEMGGKYMGVSKPSFNFGNIFGDPFPLATIGIALAGWIIAFVSSIISDVNSGFPNFAWWALVYSFFCILGVIVAVASDSVYTYHVAMVGFLSACLVFTTSSVNSLIYYSDPAKEAAAAGFILLSMVAIVWIFYYGSQPSASHRRTMDSFALHKERTPSHHNSRHMTQSYNRPETTHSTSLAPQMYNSNQLAGFETASPVVTSFAQNNQNTSQPQYRPESMARFPQPVNNPPQATATPVVQPTTPKPNEADGNMVGQPTEYPYRAKAIYSYEANPDDANEISFTKHEILEVSDVSGRWWQAKKENGETGIAPSNYLILL